MIKNYFFLYVLILLNTGCYTVFQHPEVKYSDKLGIDHDSFKNMPTSALTKINYTDNCASCHADYSYASYYQASVEEIDSTDEMSNIEHQFNQVPWWSNQVWLVEEDNTETEKVTRRSRRSYKKESTGDSQIQYIAPPGVVPTTDKSVKTGSGSNTGSGNAKSGNAQRAKESPENISPDSSTDNGKSDSKQSKQKPKRRK